MKALLLVGLLWGCGVLHAAISPWVEFTIVRGLVVIPTQVAGIDGYSVIDTGSQVTGIQHSFVQENELKFTLGRPIQIAGVNGKESRRVYQNVPATLMGADLTFKRVVDFDIDPRMQLLIGGDFLAGLYFQFDYPNKRLRAISRDTFDLKKISNVKSKIDPATRQPMAKVRLNDEHDAWLVMDTGSTSGVLMKRAPAKRQKWLQRFPVERSSIRGVTDSSAIEKFRLPKIEFGPFNVKNALVLVPPEGEPLTMFSGTQSRSSRRSKVQGLLGYDVLKNFLVTFDYRTGAMFVELPENPAPQ